MTEDAMTRRSRLLCPRTVDAERRIATAMLAKDAARLSEIAADLDAIVGGKDITTGCDVAMTMMSTAAKVLANTDTSLARKRAWADSDADFVAERIATFVASCEEDAGVPRSRRILTAELIKSF